MVCKERHNFILTFKAVCGGKQTTKPDYYNMKDKKECIIAKVKVFPKAYIHVFSGNHVNKNLCCVCNIQKQCLMC